MAMTNVKNNHTSRLFIGGVVIAPGVTAAVPKWDSVKSTAPVKGLLAGKFIEATGDSATEANGAGQLPGGAGSSATHPAGLMPAPNSAEDAEKESIIAELATFGIEKTKRTSLENLRAELDKAKVEKSGGLPGTNGNAGGMPGTNGQ